FLQELRDRPRHGGAGLAGEREVVCGGIGASRKSTRAQTTAFPGESQADDLSAHGRFAVATGFVRLQAEAAGIKWEGLSGIALQEGAVRVHQGRSENARHSAHVSAARQIRR